MPGLLSKPSTNNDDASPSGRFLVDAQRVLRLIDDERHLSAHALYQSIQERLQDRTNASSPTSNKLGFRRRERTQQRLEQFKDIEDTKQLLESKKDILNELEERCRLFQRAKANLNIDDDWILAQTLFGVTTYYRRENDGSLSIKMEGRLKDVPLFDQVAVLREVDLHYKWAPFCSSSLTIAHLNKLDTVGWFVVGLPHFGLMRDACFRALGCDSIFEDGSILLVGQGINDKPSNGVRRMSLQGQEDSQIDKETAKVLQSSQIEEEEFEYLLNSPVLKELDLPDPPTRLGSGRMTIRTFQAIINVESPTEATTRIIANVDPNLPLIPQSLLDFLMKKLCGVLLAKLQHAAKKVSRDPINNSHASKMREEEDFYKGWLMEKFKAVCKIRGWEMPPVSCFELTEHELERARAADLKNSKGKATKTIKLYHSLSEDRLDGLLDTNSEHSAPARVNQGQGPRVRALRSDSDDISELSRNSSSSYSTFWSNNPIVAYMRDVEERTRLRKAREIEKSRRKAADRLKPKDIGESSRSRLDELRAAREKRNAGMKAGQKVDIPHDATKSQRKLIRSRHKRDWATMWTHHGILTRMFFLWLLTSSLFAFLQVDTLFEDYMADLHPEWWSGWRQHSATLVLISLTASVHFVLCYVALMYSFSALQLGTIAGQQARRFYSKNVHLIVACFSGGMVALGMLKAVATTFIRWSVWRSACLLGSVKTSALTVFDASLPDSKMWELLASGLSWVGQLFHIGSDLLLRLSSGVVKLFVQSNALGRTLSSLLVYIFGQLKRPITLWNGFVNHSFAYHEGRAQAVQWREDAFATTGCLLQYSAMFLLMALLLFNLSAWQARDQTQRKDSFDDLDSLDGSDQSDPLKMLQTGFSDGSTPTRNPSPISSTSARSALSTSLTQQFETIHEGSDEEDGRSWDRNQTGPRSVTSRKKRIGGLFKMTKSKTRENQVYSTASM